MQNLLSRKDVLKLLIAENQPKETKSNHEEEKYEKVDIKVKESSIKNVTPVAKLPLERNCERVLQNHNVEASIISKKILENIKDQSESLNKRIQSRKNARIFNNGMGSKIKESNQCDKSGGEAKYTPVEEFELEVEKIMEKYVEERTSLKKEIEERYGEYISEIELMDGDVIVSLIKELNKNMQSEIDEKIKELEADRAKTIALARKKLLSKS